MILNISAEMSVLGVLLSNPDLVEKYNLPADYFGHHLTRYVYGSITLMRENKIPINLGTINDKLKSEEYKAAGGIEYLKKLIQNADKNNIDIDVSILKEKCHLRKLEKINIDTNNLITENPVDLNAQLTQKNLEREKLEESYLHATNSSLLHLGDVTDSYIRTIDGRRNNNSLLGVPTGFKLLDKYTSGLQKTHLNIIAGRVHMGKTMCMTSILQNNIKYKYGNKICVFTLEMNAHEFTSRLIAGIALVEAEKLKHSSMSLEEWYRVAWARKQIHDSNIFIDDTSAINCAYIRDSLRQLEKNEQEPELVVVDYLQIMSAEGRHQNREQEVSYISRNLKDIAKKYNVSMLAGAQLNRNPERANNNRPGLGDVRESDSISADSDTVMFVYRDRYYTPTSEYGDISEFILSKNRNGPTGTVYTNFMGEFTRFEDIRFRN